MGRLIQLELFQDIEIDRDDEKILKELAEVKELAMSTYESSNKVRKALFARHGELAKMYLDLHNRFEVIERNLCNGKP
jgi:hypothetical protein